MRAAASSCTSSLPPGWRCAWRCRRPPMRDAGLGRAPTPGQLQPTTPGETSFFRYPRHFAALAAFAGGRAERGQRTEVLSAGCSTGEETWSAAVVLDTAYGGAAGWSVLGADVDAER